jgi:hypothetical protein
VRTEQGGLIEAVAVAGAALKGDLREGITSDEQRRLHDGLQNGYEIADAIVAGARSRRRGDQAKRKDRQIELLTRSVCPPSTTRPPAPPLNRASVTVEWIEP